MATQSNNTDILPPDNLDDGDDGWECEYCDNELDVLWSGDKFGIVCKCCRLEFLADEEDEGLMTGLGYCFGEEAVTQDCWKDLVATLVEPSRSNKNDLSLRPGCPVCGTKSSLNGLIPDESEDNPTGWSALCDMCGVEVVPPGGVPQFTHPCIGIGGQGHVEVDQGVWDGIVSVFKKHPAF